MTRRQVAATLRRLAREYEKRGTSRGIYSCNSIYFALGEEKANAYGDAFEFGLLPWAEVPANSSELWTMSEEELNNMRVLLLCFAAALAETGDL
jgi:hypothetical protein